MTQGERVADGGAVAQAPVAGLIVVQCRADRIDVVGRIDGSGMATQQGIGVQAGSVACSDECACASEGSVPVDGAGRGQVEAGQPDRAAAAQGGRGGTGTTRIPGHEIPVRADVFGHERPDSPQRRATGLGRPAGVVDDRAEAVVGGGGQPGEGEGDGARRRIVAIHGHVERSTGEPRRCAVFAGPPVDGRRCSRCWCGTDPGHERAGHCDAGHQPKHTHRHAS